MHDLVKISTDENNNLTVLGRDLHEYLEVKTQYSKWFDRMCEYGFEEYKDYVAVSQKRITAQGNETTYTNHQLTLDMAKEICMIQRSEKGRKCRQYFINAEKELRVIKSTNTDSYLIDDPIKRAERWIEEQKEKQQLQITVSQQETVIKEKDEEIKEQADRLNRQRPFVQCVKKIMSTDDTVDMGQAAKMLKEDNIEIGRNTLFKLLREHEILMGNNTPYQRYVNGGIFTVTMSIVEKGGYVKSYPVTRVTGKGLFFLNKKLREWFGMEDVNDVA